MDYLQGQSIFINAYLTEANASNFMFTSQKINFEDSIFNISNLLLTGIPGTTANLKINSSFVKIVDPTKINDEYYIILEVNLRNCV